MTNAMTARACAACAARLCEIILRSLPSALSILAETRACARNVTEDLIIPEARSADIR
jgi:hypothetical protein